MTSPSRSEAGGARRSSSRLNGWSVFGHLSDGCVLVSGRACTGGAAHLRARRRAGPEMGTERPLLAPNKAGVQQRRRRANRRRGRDAVSEQAERGRKRQADRGRPTGRWAGKHLHKRCLQAQASPAVVVPRRACQGCSSRVRPCEHRGRSNLSGPRLMQHVARVLTLMMGRLVRVRSFPILLGGGQFRHFLSGDWSIRCI